MSIMAYIDPGSGAMLLQWILAGILGSGIFFRRAVFGFFGRLFERKKKGTEDSVETVDDSSKEDSSDE